ncbi:kinetochore protein ndc80 [Anaeramoeba flamelloides]|uniref:Kinetochore protein ndc80 n=1 Tax=Anaeramoeba flamelloides TaxID=1746091 RepID=A0AAV7YR16_9EUKA|nr:kinetochore protein ndc80 [Anaeramoeba flamelloides]
MSKHSVTRVYDKNEFKRFQKKTKKIKDALVIITKNLKIVHFNSGFQKLFNSSKSNITNSYFDKFLPEFQLQYQSKSVDFLKQTFTKVIDEKQTISNYQAMHITADGYEFWALVYISVIQIEEKLSFQLILKQTNNKLNSSTNSLPNVDSQLLEGNLSTSGSDFSFSSPTFSPRNEPPILKKKINISISDDEVEDEMDDIISSIKFLTRSFNDSDMEQSIIGKMNKLTNSIDYLIQQKNEKITNLINEIKNDRLKHKKKYDQLEESLSRRITGVQNIKSQTKKSKNEYELMVSKMNEFIKLFESHQEIVKKMENCLNAENISEIQK